MEKKDILGKVCLLKIKFLQDVYKENSKALIKEARPYLIVELDYLERPQLFAIPLQTSIKKSLPEYCWDKLPPRLETEIGRSRGMIYSLMIPINEDSVLSLKAPEAQIPSSEELREKLFATLQIKREDTVPEKARLSFQFLKEQTRKLGMSCFNTEQANKAYAQIAKCIQRQTSFEIDKGLDQDINGKRLIIEKANNYLKNHYLARNQKQEGNTRFIIDMPQFYTDINRLMELVKPKACENEQRIFFELDRPIRCYPFPNENIGYYKEQNGKKYVFTRLPDDDTKEDKKRAIIINLTSIKLKENGDGLFITHASEKLVLAQKLIPKNTSSNQKK